VFSQIAFTETPAERRMTFADWVALPEDEAGELAAVGLIEQYGVKAV
jgi:hypothetical protein